MSLDGHVLPQTADALQLVLIDDGQHQSEEHDEQHTHAHHDAEGPEANRNVRHHLVLRLHVAVAEVRHVLFQHLQMSLCYGLVAT